MSHSGEQQRLLKAIRVWVADRADCLWLDRVEPGRRCRVAGVVTRLRLDPRGGTIAATISDGNGSLGARWPIGPRAGQLRAAPGWGLILEGVVCVDRQGSRFLVDPTFEIVPGPLGGE